MQRLTQQQLESHFWETAWFLKKPLRTADCKLYPFSLPFSKRPSDVHYEQHGAALKEFDKDRESALFLENCRFRRAESRHFRDVREVVVNVEQTFEAASWGIGQANPHTLYDVMSDAHWTNKGVYRIDCCAICATFFSYTIEARCR
ncbi:MAG TPA: hypothetical protein VNQ90_20830 [Chthoniobacteraceae bacterium]|nr:hypothetical protein [Chthoniobacteraceae bacterium]